MLLSDLKTRESGIIVKVRGRGSFRKRISEMGFIKGQIIKVTKNAPLLDPVEYSIMGYEISLRRSEASLIEIVPTGTIIKKPAYSGTSDLNFEQNQVLKQLKTINIAFIGNPNSGKTSIFNYASRSYEHVGNYGGVTIETKLAKIEYKDYTFNLYDLPGTYSLSSFSPEEIYVRDFLSDSLPDVVVNVVDATNLERNLYLTTQLIDMNIRVVMALNMFDELRKRADKFDHINFSQMIGIPIIPTVGSKGKGLARLFEAIIKKYNEPEKNRKKIHINYGHDIEDSVNNLLPCLDIEENHLITNRLCPRYIAIKLLEGDEHIIDRIASAPNKDILIETADKERKKLKDLYADEPETLITDARFGFVSGALREVFQPNNEKRKRYSEKIDGILTHRFLGIPIFFLFLWLMFEATFRLGQAPTDWINKLVFLLSGFTERIIPPGDLQNLLTDGILGGVGGVLAFLPNILILFFFISFMEDSGYMARAAFIMDKLMHRIGLHGKSFIPLIMGFGCNVPAIMSTRIIESKNNRILTMLILPFMSCSARLPVYILIISAFFPDHQGTVLFGIYLTGILLAVLSALIFNKLFIRKDDSSFVMELPPYRFPTIKNTSRHMWSKASQYLQKIGGIILVASIIIWGLEYYPKNSNILTSVRGKPNTELNVNSIIHKGSYLERIGKTFEPIMQPMGFDWKMTVSLLAGIPGKEIVVSTLGVLYENNPGSPEQNLGERIRNDKYDYGPKKGTLVYSPLVALAYLMFILVYFPCIAVLATVANESGSIWWASLQLFYTTGLAWLLSFLVFKLGSLIIG
jgi:ferrous iron transport protein B